MVQSDSFYELYQTTYQKYRDLYGPQVCVFLRKGKFYELYGQQDPTTLEHLNTAYEVLQMLELAIHEYPGDGPHATNGFFGGIPEQSLDKWASKLTRLGWTLVIMDEVKNGAGKVSRREVTRVLSAGTHIESAVQGQSFFLACIWLVSTSTTAPKFGVAMTDLTTGHVLLYEGQATGKADAWHTDDLRHLFQLYSPKEVIVLSSTTLEEELVRKAFYIPTAPVLLRLNTKETQGNLENTLVREQFLRDQFQPKTALPLRTWLRCTETSLRERALVSLLRYVEDHVSKLSIFLQAPQIWNPKESLQIVNNALTQLNIIGSIDQLCVKDLFVKPYTAMGQRALTTLLCSPLAEYSKIKERQTRIEWFLSRPNHLQKEIQDILSTIYDIPRIHRTILRGTFKANDCLQLFQSYKATQHLIGLLQATPLSSSIKVLEDINVLLAEFQRLFDVKKAKDAIKSPNDIGFFQDTIAPGTKKAEDKCREVYTQANDWLNTLCEIAKVSKESIYYKPTDSNMFLVYATRSSLLQIEGWLKTAPLATKEHYKGLEKKVLTSSGRLEHPILDKFQESLDTARGQFQRAFSTDLLELCMLYGTSTHDMWTELEDWITMVDTCICMARTAEQQGWVKPELVENSVSAFVDIKNVRHPLIEVQKRQSKYVTHDVSLGTATSQGWLLYGMNASGKSSLMKAIGISVLLAQMGSYVPATEMRLAPFECIGTRILNQDNLWAGLSSFAVEMSELREILEHSSPKTLVLGDELCCGTESESATALVAAGIEHLHTTGARFVLATHLHDLMKLPSITNLPDLKVLHLHVEYDPIKDILVYHRTLQAGSGSSLYGLEVAKALHLPRGVIETAYKLRLQLRSEKTVEDAKQSSYNASIVRKQCSVCGITDTRLLEVHHIEEQHEANSLKRNSNGLSLNHERNLVVLCETCHDKHHAGLLRVGAVEDTSEGPKRQVLDLSKYAYEGSKQLQPQSKKKALFTTEQLEAIRNCISANVALQPKLLVYAIQKETGLTITEAQVKSILKNI